MAQTDGHPVNSDQHSADLTSTSHADDTGGPRKDGMSLDVACDTDPHRDGMGARVGDVGRIASLGGRVRWDSQ